MTELSREEMIQEIYKIMKPERRTKSNLWNDLACSISIDMGMDKVGAIMQRLHPYFDKIIPEPDQVMIGDILHWIANNICSGDLMTPYDGRNLPDVAASILGGSLYDGKGKREYLDKPIDEQDTDLISRIYSLIKDQGQN